MRTLVGNGSRCTCGNCRDGSGAGILYYLLHYKPYSLFSFALAKTRMLYRPFRGVELFDDLFDDYFYVFELFLDRSMPPLFYFLIGDIFFARATMLIRFGSIEAILLILRYIMVALFTLYTNRYSFCSRGNASQFFQGVLTSLGETRGGGPLSRMELFCRVWEL